MHGKLSLERLWVLMVTAFVDMIGYALVLPLLPLYAQDLGADPFTIGLLISTHALAQLLTAPLWGRLSDRIGRRPVIVLGQGLAAVAFLVFGLADSLWLLLVSRLAQGAGGGTISANLAYVSDRVVPEERAAALGWITASSSAGVMIGPAIGSLTVRWGTHVPGLVAMALCILNVLFAWRWLPESSPAEERAATAATTARPPLRRGLYDVVRYPTRNIHALIWIYAGGMLAFIGISGLMSLFLSDRFGITKETVGGYYFVVGLFSVVMRALILGRLVRRFGEVRVMRLGVLSLALAFIGAALAQGPWQFLAVILFMPTGTALLFPSATSLISRYSAPGQSGQVLGVQQAFGGASRFLGPIWAGGVYRSLGPTSPFWISASLVAATMIFALRLKPGEAPKPRLQAPPEPPVAPA